MCSGNQDFFWDIYRFFFFFALIGYLQNWQGDYLIGGHHALVTHPTSFQSKSRAIWLVVLYLWPKIRMKWDPLSQTVKRIENVAKCSTNQCSANSIGVFLMKTKRCLSQNGNTKTTATRSNLQREGHTYHTHLILLDVNLHT